MTTAAFWRDALERGVRTFAQTLAALLGAGVTGLLDVPWVDAASTSGLAALLSLLTSIAGSQIGRPGTASLLTSAPPVETKAAAPAAPRTYTDQEIASWGTDRSTP